MSKYCILWLLLAALQQASAQTPLYMPLTIKKAYDNQTRSYSGAPGAKYWQNKAGYNIRVTFDPSTSGVTGSEQIHYTNNSPDTLKAVNFKLFPNLFQKGAIRNMAVSPEDLTNGVAIKNLKVNGEARPLQGAIRGTNMPLYIPDLYPGQSVQFELDFSYTLNENTHIRTGSVDSGAYFIAYFFPRIAVYDDINGWDQIPYTGTQEFYNDFSDFRVAITVPGNYQVWATGDLKNTAEVYNDKYVQRIAAAEKSNDVIAVIDSNDIRGGNITRSRSANTWQYEATHVTDFAFAISNHYCWNATSVEVDATTKRRTRVDVAFNPAHADFFDVIHYARATEDKMSHHFPKWPFPYPHETVFDRVDQVEDTNN